MYNSFQDAVAPTEKGTQIGQYVIQSTPFKQWYQCLLIIIYGSFERFGSNRIFIETIESSWMSFTSFDINVLGLVLQGLAMGIKMVTWDPGGDQNFADKCEILDLLENMVMKLFILYFVRKTWRPNSCSTSDEAIM